MGRQNVSLSPNYTYYYMAQRYDNNNAKAKKKPSRLQELPFFRFLSNLLGFLLLEELLVLVVELIHTTGAVDQLHLTGVEGM